MDFELEADKELVQCRAILDAAGDHSTSIHGGIDALISERRSLRARVAELEAIQNNARATLEKWQPYLGENAFNDLANALNP